MNKLTKVGVSALCGSLAAVSAANAGSMTVGGTATATWVTHDYGVVGNPLGMATWLTFVGSGELDNGSTFSSTVALDDKSAFSSANISFGCDDLRNDTNMSRGTSMFLFSMYYVMMMW